MSTMFAQAEIDLPHMVEADLITMITGTMAEHPRTLQRAIGPSEIGHPCTRKLIHKLADHDEPVGGRDRWAAQVGTFVHTGLEQALRDHPLNQSGLPEKVGQPRFLLEERVVVGTAGGKEISGNADVFDIDTGTVVDWKALPISEPVPTPDGWTTMGELEIGQMVMGSGFQPVEVLDTFDLGENPAYRVEFNDGTYVRAAADHLWEVERKVGHGRRLMTVTTAGLRYGHGGNEDRIRALSPIGGPDADFPIHPYVLGVWLGDGARRRNQDREKYGDRCVPITMGIAKSEVTARVARFVGAIPRVNPCRPSMTTVMAPIGAALRFYGLAAVTSSQRWIPEDFILRGSRDQRMQLLYGLMDTDGTVASGGSPLYSTTSERLAEGVADLARSVGGWAKVWRKRNRNYYVLNGTRHTTTTNEYRVTIRLAINPFLCHVARSDRWEAVQKGRTREHPLSKVVKSVEPDGRATMRCIRVAADNHLFLTRSLTPTHNCVGPKMLLKYQAQGPGPQYRTQAHLYGRGFQLQGYMVRQVMIAFLPRMGELGDARFLMGTADWANPGQRFFWSEPYDETVAANAMARLNGLAQLLALLGPDKLLAQYPPCSDWFCPWCSGR